MELFSIVSGTCSILSLLISLFVASKVLQISNTVKAQGKGNIAAGGGVTINEHNG